MRHRLRDRKLSRTDSERRALFRSLTNSLFDKERITTTHAKAKEARRFAEKLITLGKRNTLASKRRAFSILRNRQIVLKLFNDIAPRFKERNGGYTRIFKAGTRAGDGAQMCILQLTEIKIAEPKPKKEKPLKPKPKAPEEVKPLEKREELPKVEPKVKVKREPVPEKPKKELPKVEKKAEKPRGLFGRLKDLFKKEKDKDKGKE